MPRCRVGFCFRREDVEIKTVFGVARCCENAALRLDAGVGELRRLQGLRPLGGIARGLPAQVADRGRGIRNSQEFADAVDGQSLQIAGGRANNVRRGSGFCARCTAQRAPTKCGKSRQNEKGPRVPGRAPNTVRRSTISSIAPDYSALTPAARMIFAHFSV